MYTCNMFIGNMCIYISKSRSNVNNGTDNTNDTINHDNNTTTTTTTTTTNTTNNNSKHGMGVVGHSRFDRVLLSILYKFKPSC